MIGELPPVPFLSSSDISVSRDERWLLFTEAIAADDIVVIDNFVERWS